MELTSASALLEMGYGYRMSRCLHAAVELGVADVIQMEPTPVEDLAAEVDCHADSLRRLLMALVSGGVFVFREGGFAHTTTSQTLRTDHPESVAGFVRFTGGNYQWQAWAGLAEAVRTGQSAFETAHGCDIFDFYRQHPVEGRAFDQAMSAAGRVDMASVVEAVGLAGGGVVADIGGGRGHLLRGILDAAPGTTGVLFDLPEVTSGATEHSDSRISFVGGDFFNDDIPPADAYIFMRILHDWGDEACTRMLLNLRRGMPAHAKVIVIESIISDDHSSSFGRLSDMTMFVLAEGRERTTAEYAALFAAAGLELAGGPIAAGGLSSILVATPV